MYSTRVSKSSTAEKIAHAWRLRLNQRIEESRALVAELRRDTGIPVGALSAEIRVLSEPTEALEVMLLVVSLYRADGRHPASRDALAVAEKFAVAHGISTFHLPFQTAMTLTLKNDWFSALEFFLSACDLARDDSERGYALANIVNCQESLGLDFTQSLQKLDSVLERNKKLSSLDGVRSQRDALELRMAFRSGRFDHVLSSSDKETTEGVIPQSVYYRLWVGALPFIKAPYHAKKSDETAFFGSSPRFLHKNYRVRTLQGILHPEDSVTPKAIVFADRLYLWTWNWLCDSEAFPLDRVIALLRDVDWQELSSGLTAEDRQMIRNSLLWLSLFDPLSTQRVKKILETIRLHRAEDFEIFGFEFSVVSYLLSLRDGRMTEAGDYLRSIKQSPFYRSKFIDLERLSNLKLRIESVCGRSNRASGFDLVIDLESCRVTSKRSKKAILSPAMVKGFELLSRQGSVGCSEFLSSAFGIPKFDSEIHAPKIANLVARMRQVAPTTLKLTVKDSKVHAIGSWESIEIKRGSGVSLKLHEVAGAQAPRSKRASPVDSSHWLLKLSAKKEIRREDIESVTGKSRASANRIIERWLAQGVLKREGSARNTIYRMKKRAGAREERA